MCNITASAIPHSTGLHQSSTLYKKEVAGYVRSGDVFFLSLRSIAATSRTAQEYMKPLHYIKKKYSGYVRSGYVFLLSLRSITATFPDFISRLHLEYILAI